LIGANLIIAITPSQQRQPYTCESRNTMDKDELAEWARKSGWIEIGGHFSLTKPSNPKEAIVRMVMKGTVVNVEIKKPVGKWEKVFSSPYSKIAPDPETGFPRGLGFETMSNFSMLLEDNKNRAVFAKLSTPSKPAG
jgi:hypothetical protein